MHNSTNPNSEVQIARQKAITLHQGTKSLSKGSQGLRSNYTVEEIQKFSLQSVRKYLHEFRSGQTTPNGPSVRVHTQTTLHTYFPITTEYKRVERYRTGVNDTQEE